MTSVGGGQRPFPREDFTALLRRLPAYARLAWGLARDPRLSRARRAAVLAGAAYLVSPVDLVPGIIPVVGQLDDLVVALGAIRLALGGLPPEARLQQLRGAGLSGGDLDADLRTTAAIAGWLGRRGLRLGRDLLATTLEVGSRAAGAVLDAGRQMDDRRRDRR